MHPLIAAALGLVFVIGRWLYFRGYVKDPKKREMGFILSVVPNVILLLGGLIGIVRVLLMHPTAADDTRRRSVSGARRRAAATGQRASGSERDGDDAQRHHAEVLLHEGDVAEQVTRPR